MREKTYFAMFGTQVHAKLKAWRTTSKAFRWWHLRAWRVHVIVQVER